jgi:ADP-ribosylglycohydrolase
MTTLSPLERARLSLAGLSLGDSLGHALMWQPDLIPRRGEPRRPWPWSDDTEMSLSIVATLEAHGQIDQEDLAARFARTFSPGRLYGQLMEQEYFPRVRRGESFREVARSLHDGEGSLGNGAAMRSAPLGAYFAGDLPAVVAQATLAATVTHTHPEGIAGAIAVAVAAALVAADHEGATLLAAVAPLVPDGAVRAGLERALRLPPTTTVAAAAQLGNGRQVTAADTVPFALWSAARGLGRFERAVWDTIQAIGDMDTNGAIVGGIVALSVGHEGLPARWLEAREPLPVAPAVTS